MRNQNRKVMKMEIYKIYGRDYEKMIVEEGVTYPIKQTTVRFVLDEGEDIAKIIPTLLFAMKRGMVVDGGTSATQRIIKIDDDGITARSLHFFDISTDNSDEDEGWLNERIDTLLLGGK